MVRAQEEADRGQRGEEVRERRGGKVDAPPAPGAIVPPRMARLQRELAAALRSCGIHGDSPGVPRIFTVDSLVEEPPQGAARRHRIAIDDSAMSTGWFIAPQIVAIPGFAIPSDSTGKAIRIQSFEGIVATWEETTDAPPEYLGPISSQERAAVSRCCARTTARRRLRCASRPR
jgi:hypothetical protein